MYNQCSLKKGNIQQTAWIPSKFAEVGMPLKIRGDDGWVVESVGAEAENPPDRQWKKHRGNTDVPKGTFKGKR